MSSESLCFNCVWARNDESILKHRGTENTEICSQVSFPSVSSVLSAFRINSVCEMLRLRSLDVFFVRLSYLALDGISGVNVDSISQPDARSWLLHQFVGGELSIRVGLLTEWTDSKQSIITYVIA